MKILCTGFATLVIAQPGAEYYQLISAPVNFQDEDNLIAAAFGNAMTVP